MDEMPYHKRPTSKKLDDDMLYSPYKYRETEGSEDQQNTIDRAKGIIAKPMPETWYNRRANTIKPDDSEETINQKTFDLGIIADKKPYFMIYVYPHLKREYDEYFKKVNFKANAYFGKDIQELIDCDELQESEKEFLYYYYLFLPVGNNPCVINRISWIFEKEFDKYLRKINSATDFDYDILKSDTTYSKSNYNQIMTLYYQYMMQMDKLHKRARIERFDDLNYERQKIIESFKMNCEIACTNEDELCNIVLDICYTKEGSKQFAWDICGEQIIRNLLSQKNNKVSFPERSCNNYNFKYSGEAFIMKEIEADIV